MRLYRFYSSRLIECRFILNGSVLFGLARLFRESRSDYFEILHWVEKMLVHCDELQFSETKENRAMIQSVLSQQRDIEKTIERLLDLHLDGSLDKESYLKKKKELITQKVGIAEKLKTFEGEASPWLELQVEIGNSPF